jgi:hypothetical protein
MGLATPSRIFDFFLRKDEGSQMVARLRFAYRSPRALAQGSRAANEGLFKPGPEGTFYSPLIFPGLKARASTAAYTLSENALVTPL